MSRRRDPMNPMPYVLFLLVCGIWGSNFMLMKRASLAFDPFSIGAARTLGAAFVLAFVWKLRSRSPTIRRHDLVPLLLVVLVGHAGPFAIQPYLIARHGGAFVGMMVSLVPLVTVLASAPMLRVYPTPRQLIGVVGGLFCMGIVFADGLQRSVPIADLGLALTVPIGYALTNTFIKRRLPDMPALELTGVAMAGTAIVLAPFALATETVRVDSDFDLALGALILLGTVGTGFANSLFVKLVQDHGPLFAGMAAYLIPFGALIWGWVDREHISGMQLVALSGIFLMVGVVQYGAAGPPTPAES